MRKKILYVMAVAGCALLNSCSNNEHVPVIDDSEQQLTIQIASSGDGLQTRAGRPLYASNADQQIDNVKVIVKTASGEIKYASVIQDWNSISSSYTNSGHGRQYTLVLKGEDKLNTGNYTIVAVGYSNSSSYIFNPTMDATIKGYPLNNGISAEYSGDAEEIFAGSASVEVGDDKSFAPVTVTLHRQVAGAIGYFTKVPASVDGTAAKFLRLVTRSKNEKVTFTNFNTGFKETESNVQYTVNGSEALDKDANFFGSNALDGNVLYTVDLSQWFTGSGSMDTNGDGFLDASDTWTHPISVQTVLTKGTVFVGKFIIPFALTTGKRTMELQLLAEGGTILRSWGVNIPSSEVATGKTSPEVNDEDVSVFNVVRNHMYNLGVKTTHENPTDPNNPGGSDQDPDDDPTDGDDPTDLSKNQDLVLKVNDNWEMIHQMEID